MLKFAFLFVILIHGLIHILGFLKAFNIADVNQLSEYISKPMGMLWLTTTLLFLVTAIIYYLEKDWWWMVGASAIIISQLIIITAWQDAKFGTIANIIVLIVVFLNWGSWQFENTFNSDVEENLKMNNDTADEMLTEKDIEHLPEPVKRYLIYANVLNRPKVKNVKIIMEGEMIDKKNGPFNFISEQYNFFDEPARLFFMKGEMFGFTVPGYHKYNNTKASMNIRLFGLFPLVNLSGEIMDKTETVTLFNDMCLMAPATLIDNRIKWETIDSNTVKAQFTNHSITITAMLYFSEQGKLINFTSNDRTAVQEMKQYPFATPVHSYKNVNGINVLSKGDAVWHYPEGNFTYGKFKLKCIEYNCVSNI